MNKKYHFISGLPRSGSTLLVSILNQNPRFHANISDALYSCYSSIVPAIYQAPELPITCDQEKTKVILRSIVDSFYYNVDKEVIFNCNRGWTNILDLVNTTHENAKIICCARSINWILNSYEKVYSNRGLTIAKLHEKSYGSVYSRTRNLFPEGPLYRNYQDLMQAYYGPFKHKLLVIDYDDLAKTPKESIDKIYDFIGEEKFNHDFDNVERNYQEFDDVIGLPGLHNVKPKIEFIEPKQILPPDIFDKYKGMEFWRN